MKKIIPLSLLFLFQIALLHSQPADFQSRGVGGGGAMFFPRVNPGNDNEFYVASDLSAFFHTANFGNSYEVVDFRKLQALNVSTYEFTSNPNIAYCNFNDGNEGYPVRTTNGASSWQLLPGHDAGNGQVYRMAANYNKPDQLLLNYYGDIFISNNQGTTLQLVKHTVNNGAGLVMGGVFFEGDNIYIGTNEGLLYSTNGGTSFNLMATTGIPAGQVIWSFAAGKEGATTRFVCITANVSDTYNGIQPWEYYGLAKGVYTMDNASGAWQTKSAGIDFNNDFVMYAAMAWNNANTIYLGGNDAALGAPLVYKSTDGGSAWEKVFKSANNQNILTGWSGSGGDKGWSWGENCFGISVAPYNANKVLFGDFGFVHVSNNGGDSWKQAYVNNLDQHPAGSPTPKQQTYHSIGLENTTSWQLHWQNQNTLLAAFSDIGLIRSTDAGQTWGFTYTGMSVNSTYRLAKSATGTLFAATSNIHDMYQSTRLRDAQLDANDGNGKISYSTNDGASWQLLHAFNHPVYWIAIDPNNANRMYASVIHFGGGGAGMQGGIWRTDNLNNLAASTWTQLPAPPRTEGHPASLQVLDDGKVLCSYSGRINASGQFTASSGVFLYNPATNSWSDLSDSQMYYWTKDVVVDPADPTQSTWYACVFSGWGGAPNGKGGLFRTANRGANWTKLTGSQFDRVSSITFNPQDASEAYLTTETEGLWVSNDMNAVTPAWLSVAAYPFRQPERVYFNPYNLNEMWVSSFGNGIRIGTLQPSGVSAASDKNSGIEISPNPAGSFIQVRVPEGGRPLRVFDAQGRMVWENTTGATGPEYRIETANWAPGLYWVQWGGSSCRFVRM